MNLTHAEHTYIGPTRAHNEDSLGVLVPDDLADPRARGALFVLCDGLGGHGNGERASRMAVDFALKIFQESGPGLMPRLLLARIFNTANTGVHEAGIAEAQRIHMATTMTVLLLKGAEVHLGHVGDSRAYRVRGGECQRLTTDHTVAGMQTRLGLISERDAQASEMRSLLTRSIGNEPTVAPDYSKSALLPGDILILCSDGLHGWVPDQELGDIVQTHPPEEACEILIKRAGNLGSDDNVSVIVVRVDALAARTSQNSQSLGESTLMNPLRPAR